MAIQALQHSAEHLLVLAGFESGSILAFQVPLECSGSSAGSTGAPTELHPLATLPMSKYPSEYCGARQHVCVPAPHSPPLLLLCCPAHTVITMALHAPSTQLVVGFADTKVRFVQISVAGQGDDTKV